MKFSRFHYEKLKITISLIGCESLFSSLPLKWSLEAAANFLILLAPRVGLEPTTYGLTVRCSTN